MTDKELRSALIAANAEYDRIGKQMEELAQDMNRPPRMGEDLSAWDNNHEKISQKYYAAQDQLREIRDRRFELQQESNRRTPKDTSPRKPFVNSFGEATDRYITSAAYERAMRRNEREIRSFMGRR